MSSSIIPLGALLLAPLLGQLPTQQDFDVSTVEPQATLLSPSRIAATPSGDLLVSDYRAGAVVILDPLTLAEKARVEIAGRPIAVGAFRERIAIGNETARQVQLYTTEGRLIGAYGGSSFQVEDPRDLAVDTALSRLFVVDGAGKRIVVFDAAHPERRPLATIGGPGSLTSEFQNPTGIVLDTAAQELYVSDYGGMGMGKPARVLVFAYDGTFLEYINGDGGPTGQYFARPQGLALGPVSGHLFVVDAWRGEVVVMDRATKQQVGVLGKYGDQPGELLLPMDAVVREPGDDLLVVSNRSKRIEVFTGGGQL